MNRRIVPSSLLISCLIRQAKSATKPHRIEHLDGIHIIDLACGQNTTFFIARPPPSSLPPPVATSSSTTSVTASAPAVAGTSATPAVDLSGFGFDFAPPAGAAVVTQKAILPKPETGISRTEQGPWEALARFPYLDEIEGGDNCHICGNEDDAAGGDALECEMVSSLALSLPSALLQFFV